MPSSSNCFALCGKERLAIGNAPVVPGDVIAAPKMPEDVVTNDVLVVPAGVTATDPHTLHPTPYTRNHTPGTQTPGR